MDAKEGYPGRSSMRGIALESACLCGLGVVEAVQAGQQGYIDHLLMAKQSVVSVCLHLLPLRRPIEFVLS